MKERIMTTILGISLITSPSVYAIEKNPFGLVYQNALTENVAGKVNIHHVSYKLHGIDIAANIYTPADYNPDKMYPAIVVAHPNGGVKEQVAGLYAQKLAENGYITITADAAFQGASGGEPRHQDFPYYREEDIHGMIDYISKFAGVDISKIGALGICGGGGYTLKAAQSDKRLQAVATISMFNTGRVRRNGYGDTQRNSIQDRLNKAVAARQHEIETGEVVILGKMDFSDDVIAKLPDGLYKEGAVYYGKTHAHPNSSFEYTEGSLMYLMTWDATDQIELLNQPLLMIAGEKADSLYLSQDAFAKATGTKDKELFIIPNATHIQTYYVPEYVNTAVTKLIRFYNDKLSL